MDSYGSILRWSLFLDSGSVMKEDKRGFSLVHIGVA
jgi:hypothetical protein